MSELREDPDQRKKLAAIADVERRTHTVLEDVASRLGIEPALAQIEATVARRALELKKLTWFEFIEKAMPDRPPYIDRFEDAERLAPPIDAPAPRLLVDHDLALVKFVRLERRHSHDSLRPLEAFLAGAAAAR